MKVSALKLKLVSIAASMNLDGLSARELAALLDSGIQIKEEAKEEENKDLFLPFLDNFIQNKEKQSTKDVYKTQKRKYQSSAISKN